MAFCASAGLFCLSFNCISTLTLSTSRGWSWWAGVWWQIDQMLPFENISKGPCTGLLILWVCALWNRCCFYYYVKHCVESANLLWAGPQIRGEERPGQGRSSPHCPILVAVWWETAQVSIPLGVSDRHRVLHSRGFLGKKLEVKLWSFCLGK